MEESYLDHFLWNCPQVNATRLCSRRVNISSGNGLVPSGTKPLPEPMLTKFYDAIWVNHNIITVGTPYNTNVGVQKIPDRAIWKPMVAKRNNTNPWSWLRPQILVTQDSGQSHMSKQPASRDWPEQIAPLVHSSQTAWQLFNLGQSIEICIPHLLGHVGQLHTKCISHIWLRFSVL